MKEQSKLGSWALALAGGIGAAFAVGLLRTEGTYAVILALVGSAAYGAILHRRRVAAGANPHTTIPLGIVFCGPLLAMLGFFALQVNDKSPSDANWLVFIGGCVVMPIVGWVMMRTSRFGVPANSPEQLHRQEEAATALGVAPEPTPAFNSPVQSIVQPAGVTSADTPDASIPEQVNEAPISEPVKSRGSSWFIVLVYAMLVVGLIDWIFTDNVDEKCKDLILEKTAEPRTASFAPREDDDLRPPFDVARKYTVESRLAGRTVSESYYCGVNKGTGKVGIMPWP